MKMFFSLGFSLLFLTTAWADPGGLWDMAALSKVPSATWGEAKEQIREVY